MELVRTRTQERGCERLSTVLGRTRGLKGEIETKDYLEKSCRKRERGKAGWQSQNAAKAVAHNRGGWADNVMALCAYRRNER